MQTAQYFLLCICLLNLIGWVWSLWCRPMYQVENWGMANAGSLMALVGVHCLWLAGY